MTAYRCLLALWTLIRRARVCVPMLVVALFSVACASDPMRAQTANDCDEVESAGDVPGHPKRLPHIDRLIADSRLLPSVDEVPWFGDSPERVRLRIRKYLISQPGDPPQERSPWFGGAAPRIPMNAVCLAQKRDLEIAIAGAKGLGIKVGIAVASCDIATESLNNRVDHHGGAWQRPDSKVFDLVLANCEADLLAIPPMPPYDDPQLLTETQLAFEKGVEAGILDVYLRILAAEAGLAVVEIAAFEAAPYVGLKVLNGITRALVRLRQMPILLPLAVDGAGVVIKLARPVIKGSSRALRANMKLAKRPPAMTGEVPHHIAAHGDPRAAKSIEILEGFGIKADHEANGVNLPGYASSPNPKGKVVHGNLHTNAYHDAVRIRLEKAKTKAEAEEILRRIGYGLEHGITPK